MEENSLWVEKYRPDSLDNYIGNQSVKDKMQQYIEQNDVPHILLYGSAGTGKSTLCKILIKHLDCDYIWINASDENNVETVRNKIKNFASTIGFNKWKIVILDEADFLTPSAQAILRELSERYSQTTRFILTANYPEKIIPAIQSRCQMYNIIPPSKKDIAVHVAGILDNEEVTYTPADLKVIIDSTYPDIRKVINDCQKQSMNGELKLDKQSLIEANYALKVIEILKDKSKNALVSLKEIRQLFADSQVKDYTPLYQLLYENVDSYSNGKSAEIILKITEYEYQSQMRIIKELSAASLVISILELIK